MAKTIYLILSSAFFLSLFLSLHLYEAAPTNVAKANMDKKDRAVETFRNFIGWDCTNPLDVSPVVPAGVKNCNHLRETPITTDKAVFTVLQNAALTRFQVRSCKAYKTQNAEYCGTFDHQTYLPEWSTDREPVELSAEECDRLWKKAYMVDSLKRSHPINVPGVTYFTYETVGNTKWSDTDHVNCIGGSFLWDGVTYTHVMISAKMEVHLHMMDVQEDVDGQIFLVADSTKLTCRGNEYKCHNMDTTYTWSGLRPTEQCRLFMVRSKVRGVLAKTTDKQTAFMAKDGSMVRLIRKEALSMCGAVVYATNWPDTFLTSAVEHQLFKRKMHAAEVSILHHASIGSNYVYEAGNANIRVAFRELMREDCEIRDNEAANAFAQLASAQRANTDGQSAALGEGKFVTASGDLWYTYQCKPVSAVAILLPKCHAALAVKLTDADTAHYLAKTNNNVSRDDLQLYLMPHSHLLVDIARTMPCSHIFAPIYKNSREDWVAAGDTLQLVQTPVPADFRTNRTGNVTFAELDSYSGGYYTSADLERAERFRQQGQVVDAWTSDVANQANRGLPAHRSGRDWGLDVVYREVPGSPRFWDMMKAIWNFSMRLGTTGAAIFALVFIWYLLSSTVGTCQRCYISCKEEGCGCNMVGALFPANFWHRMLGLSVKKAESKYASTPCHSYACKLVTQQDLRHFIRTVALKDEAEAPALPAKHPHTPIHEQVRAETEELLAQDNHQEAANRMAIQDSLPLQASAPERHLLARVSNPFPAYETTE